MKRRKFVKTVSYSALLPATLSVKVIDAEADNSAAGKPSPGTSGTSGGGAAKNSKLPDYAGKLGYSDGSITNPDGSVLLVGFGGVSILPLETGDD